MANTKRLREALLTSSKRAVQSGRSAAPGVGEHSGAVWLPVAEILPDEAQPRTHIDDEALAKLVESIRSIGQVEPILVEPLRGEAAPGGKRFRCLSGHRRLRAHEVLGLAEIKATIVREELGAAERLVHEIAANEAREDHTDFDRARFLTRVFADRLAIGGTDEERLERVRYLVNRAYNELDRTGAFRAESAEIVTNCEEALRAIGERRNLRWYHRWGLPLLALRGAARDAAVSGLDARRTLAIARLAPKGKASAAGERVVAELAAIVAKLNIPGRDVASAVKELGAAFESGGPDGERVRAILDALARGGDRDDAPLDVAEPSAAPRLPGTKRTRSTADAPLRQRVEALANEWMVTVRGRATGRKGRAATPVLELLASLPASAGPRLERLVRALETADRELAAILAAPSED
jgi:ParB/RepB/Spo0J family partition protein